MKEITDLLSEYKFEHLFGGALLHKHYEIASNERVLWENIPEGYASHVTC
jgi:hypothetical protein